MKFFPGKEDVKGIAQDAAGTALEVGASTVLENLPELGAEVAQLIGNEAVSTTVQTLTGGLLGGLAPAFLGIKLTYQQKRFERNILKMINEVKQRQDIIAQRLDLLPSEIRQKFIDGPYRDVLFDNTISENQEQKVQDNIYGYINLMALESPNDDVVFTFFNTLSQMNELDIRILRLYRPSWECADEEQENYMDIMAEEHIDESQYNFIRQKLQRLGMLSSKNEEKRNKNLDAIGSTLSELIKQLSSKNPKTVKAPRLERISHFETYEITRLGRQYLDFIDEPKQQTENVAESVEDT